MDLLLQYCKVLCELFEDLNSSLDHKVVSCFGILEGAPHDSLELIS